MCDHSCQSCTIGPLACVKVRAAFGNEMVSYSALRSRAGTISANQGGHWSKRHARRPVARVNERGEKLCARDGCTSVRAFGATCCAEHRREYQRKYREQNRQQLNERRRWAYAESKSGR